MLSSHVVWLTDAYTAEMEWEENFFGILFWFRNTPEAVNLNIPFTSVVFPELSKPTIKQLEEQFDLLVI